MDVNVSTFAYNRTVRLLNVSFVLLHDYDPKIVVSFVLIIVLLLINSIF